MAVVGCAAPPTPRAPRREAPERPHVVLVTLDTTRADHLGVYGYFRATAPFLDRLAARSVVFEQMLAPMATTLPTHTSIFTGTHPLEHGVLSNVAQTGVRHRASDSLQTFAELARDAGYATAAFVSATPLRRGSGADRGFEHFDQPDRVAKRSAAKTTAACLAWLRARRKIDKRPFFLWIHYYDPHGPFRPPAGLRDRFDGSPALEAWLDARGTTRQAPRPTGQVLDVGEEVNLYDAEITSVDRQLELLFEEARGAGRWHDKALTVIVGDHGEGLGQHGMAGHGEVWHEQLHAPFLLHAAWLEPKRIPWAVSAEDVFPTVLGLVDLPGEERFLAQASGVDALRPRPRPLLAVTSERQERFGAPARRAITVGPWRLLRSDEGAEGLFHRAHDPHELVDLGAALPLHRELLGRWIDEEVEARARRAAVIGEPVAVPTDAETVEALRTLGYLEAEE